MAHLHGVVVVRLRRFVRRNEAEHLLCNDADRRRRTSGYRACTQETIGHKARVSSDCDARRAQKLAVPFAALAAMHSRMTMVRMAMCRTRAIDVL